MKILELVRQSVLDDSNVSAMRVNCLLVILMTVGVFVLMNVTGAVQAIIGGKPVAILDIPVAAASLASSALLFKAVQTFGEKETTKKEEK
jgi:hypothetical protein